MGLPAARRLAREGGPAMDRRRDVREAVMGGVVVVVVIVILAFFVAGALAGAVAVAALAIRRQDRPRSGPGSCGEDPEP